VRSRIEAPFVICTSILSLVLAASYVIPPCFPDGFQNLLMDFRIMSPGLMRLF